MKNLLYKLHILFVMLKDTFFEWKDEVFCCGGGSAYNPCGCDGITYREQWNFHRLGKG
jgi:hypothetical protein